MRYCAFFGIVLMVAMYSGSGCTGAQGSSQAQVPIKIAKPTPLPPEEERPDPGLEVVEKVRLSEEGSRDIAIYIDGADNLYVLWDAIVGMSGRHPRLRIRKGGEWSPVRVLRPLSGGKFVQGFVDENGEFLIYVIRRKQRESTRIEFYPISPELWDTSLPAPRPSKTIVSPPGRAVRLPPYFQTMPDKKFHWVRRFAGLSQTLLLVGTYDEHNPLRGPCLTRLQRICTSVVKDGVVQKSQRVTSHGAFGLVGYRVGDRESLPVALFPDGTAFMVLLKNYIRTPPPEEHIYLAYFDGERWHGCDAQYLPEVSEGPLYPYQAVPYGSKVLVFLTGAVLEFDPRIIKTAAKTSQRIVLTETQLADLHTRIPKALVDKKGNVSVLMGNVRSRELSLIRRIEGRWSRPLKITENSGGAHMAIDTAGNHHIIWTKGKGGLWYYLAAPKQRIAAPETP